MTFFTRLSALVVGFAAVASAAWADVPFKPTTITGGLFAADTEWYVLENGAGKLRISDNGANNYIQLGGFMTNADENLWCFVGNETDGFKIYNKKQGTTKALAAPKSIKGDKDGTAYAYLQTVSGLASTQTNLWDFTAATKTHDNKDLSITGGYYINEHGTAANKLNNRGSKLAFWVRGYDNGSVITITNVKDYTFVEREPQTDLLISTGQPNYRIPAITKAYNGDIIAVADYRFKGGDIGNGRLDLHSKVSTDNGATWSNVKEVVRGIDYVEGQTSSPYLQTGFGDPCIVADRESNRVLLMSCSGNVTFQSGTRNNHQGIARFYSDDNGQTWSAPTDISESIYSQFDTCTIGTAKSMFIGSGRIFQSSTTKVGNYYRLYCSVLFKDVNGTNKNYVIYSDDFGQSWLVLGGVNVAPIPSGGDEPKAEELPDGSILCSSRIYGGRMYNIYHFTNVTKAEGYWDTAATSNANNKGVVATDNSCNGEVMVLPVVRKSDGKKMHLLLQSVPFGSGRTNVGIYYKELATVADYATPAALAANWTGHHQSSYMGSAYSTMALQKDNTIGFLYEESTYGYDYTIVYKNYTIETITDGAYSYNTEYDRSTVFTSAIEVVKAKAEDVKNNVGTNVGCYTEAAVAGVTAAAEAFEANPSIDTYTAFNAALVQANKHTVGIQAGGKYRIRNAERQNGTLYLKATTSGTGVQTFDENEPSILFTFEPSTSVSGAWLLHCEGTGVFVSKTGAIEVKVPVVTTEAAASPYRVSSYTNGKSALICTNPTGGNSSLHLAGDCVRIVPWTADAGASRWYIEPVDITTDIATVETTVKNQRPAAIYDLQGRRLNAVPKRGIYITSDRKKHLAK